MDAVSPVSGSRSSHHDSNRHGLLKNGLLVGGTIIPVLCAMMVQAWEPAPQEKIAGGARPALTFEQYLVNESPYPIEPRQYVYARFAFTNWSDRTVVVKELVPSCGCLNPQLDKRVYEPGEQGQFFLRVATASEEPGPKEYYVKFRYEDPEPREVELAYKVILPEQQVVVRPRALIFYQFDSQPTSQQIVITDYRGRQLQLTGIESSSDFVSARHTGTSTDDEGNHELHVQVTVGAQVPPGRHRALLNFRTDDPEYSLLQVPLLIQGPVDEPGVPGPAALQVEPATLRFSARSASVQEDSSPEQEPAVTSQTDPNDSGADTIPPGALTQELTVIDRSPKPVTITRIDAGTEFVKAQIVGFDHLSDGRHIRIAVTVNEALLQDGSYRGVLTIRTDSLQQSTLQVPLLISSDVETSSRVSSDRAPSASAN